MKVLLVNGSPHEHGCTYTALSEIERTLNAEGVETEVFWIGTRPISGCLDCGYCSKHDRCVMDDIVNDFVDKAWKADGFVFGAPVHYAGVPGSMTSFMNRAFYSGTRRGKGAFYLKPAATIVSARRAGTTAALDQFGKYLLYQEMLTVGSRYWNMVHGYTPEDVRKDEEGLQIMRVLAKNLAYVLRLKEAGAAAGVRLPEPEEKIFTDFIR